MSSLAASQLHIAGFVRPDSKNVSIDGRNSSTRRSWSQTRREDFIECMGRAQLCRLFVGFIVFDLALNLWSRLSERAWEAKVTTLGKRKLAADLPSQWNELDCAIFQSRRPHHHHSLHKTDTKHWHASKSKSQSRAV